MRMDRRAGLLALVPLEIAYTGSYTDELVTMDGASYRLLTLTSSGTLTASRPVAAEVWLCGGGGCGGSRNGTPSTQMGGAGGYAASTSASFKNLTVVVGAGLSGNSGTVQYGAGGQTSISGDISLTANGGNSGDGSAKSVGDIGNGGTGGGGGGDNDDVGSGDGIAKTPFGSNYFAYPYCDGGGGGSNFAALGSSHSGGAGGTNGGNGGVRTNSGTAGGAGGGHYGGAGGAGTSKASERNGANATGYGSGGGGCGYRSSRGNAGNGYQGVCFIRIPA